jgi:hypothetical protein
MLINYRVILDVVQRMVLMKLLGTGSGVDVTQGFEGTPGVLDCI